MILSEVLNTQKNRPRFFQPFGSHDLDNSFLSAVEKTTTLPLPDNKCLKAHNEYFKQTIYYHHTDMVA